MTLLPKCLTPIVEVPARAEETPTCIGYLSGPECMAVFFFFFF